LPLRHTAILAVFRWNNWELTTAVGPQRPPPVTGIDWPRDAKTQRTAGLNHVFNSASLHLRGQRGLTEWPLPTIRSVNRPPSTANWLLARFSLPDLHPRAMIPLDKHL